MKKFSLLLILLLATVPLVFGGTAYAEETSPAQGEYISAESLRELTETICTETPDRTSFTEACKNSAEKLCAYITMSGGLNAEVQTFTRTVTMMSGLRYVTQDITSYNIVATQKQPDPTKKTVLFTANFGNHFSDNVGGSGVGAAGALSNAASVALTIGLANYLTSPEILATLPYNVQFAFFSGTDEGNFGSDYFAENYPLGDVILVVNFERIGCGTTFFYTDEAETEHGKFIRQLSKDTSLKEFPTAGRVLLESTTVDGLPYTHYAMRGDVSTFLSLGKSCLELIGGKFSGLKYDEGGKIDLTNTSDDTYAKLEEIYPDFADKLAETANFAVTLVSDARLADVCLGAATSYKTFATPWIGYVIALGVLVILIAIMIAVVSVLERKYPLPKSPKVKVAVFGKEFEEPSDGEILVDFESSDDKSDNDVDPFDV